MTAVALAAIVDMAGSIAMFVGERDAPSSVILSAYAITVVSTLARMFSAISIDAERNAILHAHASE